LHAPQPEPTLIYTSKLTQILGQSEIRIGIRSSEFGNICISTSSTRELISTQIALDHSELAKTLTTHLLEMQGKWNADQAVDFRIGLNGQTTGVSGAMLNGAAGESHGDQEQSHRSYAGNAVRAHIGRQSSTDIAAVSAGESGLNTRLDIRI